MIGTLNGTYILNGPSTSSMLLDLNFNGGSKVVNSLVVYTSTLGLLFSSLTPMFLK